MQATFSHYTEVHLPPLMSDPFPVISCCELYYKKVILRPYSMYISDGLANLYATVQSKSSYLKILEVQDWI
jgi:hypothetical protein